MARIATFYDHITEIARQENISLAEAMQEAAGLGVELLEVMADSIVGHVEEMDRVLGSAGMGISSIPSFFDFGRNADVDAQSGPIIEAAKYLGARQMLVIPGFFDPADDEEAKERQTRSMIDCVCRLEEKAAGCGVSLVMEEFGNKNAPFSTTAGLRRFLDSCRGVSCCFDAGNFRYSMEEETTALEALIDRVKHVHLKDWRYDGEEGEESLTALDGRDLYPAPIGGGILRLKEVVARLRRSGYDGIYTVEHYNSAHMLDCLTQSVNWTREQLA